jgi:hypothetical protein
MARTRLTSEEHRLYVDLVEGVLGDRVRLEDGRFDWGWAERRLLATPERVGRLPASLSHLKPRPAQRLSEQRP